MRKSLIFVLVLCLLLVMMGCSKAADKKEEIIGCTEEDCALVYDGAEYITYNTTLKSKSGKISSEDNEFQYRLFQDDRYITSGNSMTNHFKIMERSNTRLLTVYEHDNENEALFPFAIIDGQYVYAVMEYKGDRQKFVGLFRLNSSGDLEQLKTNQSEMTDKIFGIGIHAEDNVYTLLYDNGKQDLYKTDPSLASFELVAEDVSRTLSTLKDEVCYMKDQSLYCGKAPVQKLNAGTALAWVIADRYVLEVDDTGNYQVKELQDGKELLSGARYIGYNHDGSQIVIYSEGKMDVLEG
ncbi:hypothetical protein [Paenibacillus xylaniclasticus]|uniref:hypothetical protein n=1 Tax=Paenibacillus xylaniclasticus TaxID=588083 RepID=UPI000FD75F5F|nr:MULTISPECIES: hypothetical protein [Paenibacillus]GFN31239.1 hypothetical protein PCURB6_14990 [Paenibacillus curdlanolyticus]